MKTYQDLLALGESEKERMDFIASAVAEHKNGEIYKTARIAELYARHQNVTINQYQKLLYTISGKAVPDNYSANHKCASNFFDRFITQQNQYLLGNGVTFEKEETKQKLGRDFDAKMQQAGKAALIGGVSFCFWNFDRVDVFKITEIAPIYDEENGTLSAAIRFWQIDESKPIRYVLYEIDGYTEYIKRRDEEMKIYRQKREYREIVRKSEADGVEISNGGNYPGFPIVPLWANDYHQSELVGMREQIDCYDLIKSGFANDLDEASLFYWTLENCGGMKPEDIAKFVHQIKTLHAANVDGDEGAKATAHTMEVPYEGREAYLSRLENDMYNDFMALNVSQIAAGKITATQINAAYEPLNEKTDQFEYQVTTCIHCIFDIAGIDDEPKYRRSKIINQLEETEMVLMASAVLDDETILKKLPWLTPEEVAEVMERKTAEDSEKFFTETGGGDEL